MSRTKHPIPSKHVGFRLRPDAVANLAELVRILQRDRPDGTITGSEAIHTAVREAVERRKNGTKRK